MATKKTASTAPAANGSAERVPRLHVQMRDGAWRVREGRRLGPAYATRDEAVSAARAIGKERNVEILLYRADGSFMYEVLQGPLHDLLVKTLDHLRASWNDGDEEAA